MRSLATDRPSRDRKPALGASVVISVLAIGGPVWARDCSALFRATDEFGMDQQLLRLELSWTASGRGATKVMTGDFARTVILPCGKFSFAAKVLTRSGEEMDHKGGFELIYPEQQITLHLKLPYLGKPGERVYATWEPRPGRPFYSGRVEGWKEGHDRGWILIQEVFGKARIDAAIGENGSFAVYPPLRGVFMLIAVVNGTAGPPLKLVLSGIKKEPIVLPAVVRPVMTPGGLLR